MASAHTEKSACRCRGEALMAETPCRSAWGRPRCVFLRGAQANQEEERTVTKIVGAEVCAVRVRKREGQGRGRGESGVCGAWCVAGCVLICLLPSGSLDSLLR